MIAETQTIILKTVGHGFCWPCWGLGVAQGLMVMAVVWLAERISSLPTPNPQNSESARESEIREKGAET